MTVGFPGGVVHSIFTLLTNYFQNSGGPRWVVISQSLVTRYPKTWGREKFFFGEFTNPTRYSGKPGNPTVTKMNTFFSEPTGYRVGYYSLREKIIMAKEIF